MKHILMYLTITITALFVSQVMADCTNPNTNIVITKPNSIYVDNGDGTVTDRQTGLMWRKCSIGQSGTNCETGSVSAGTWQASLAIANENNDSGYSDWRLPNTNELFSLVETACASPSINEAFFPQTPSGSYWSSSTYADGYNTRALYVLFNHGYVFGNLKNSNRYIRLVRGNN